MQIQNKFHKIPILMTDSDRLICFEGETDRTVINLLFVVIVKTYDNIKPELGVL